MAIIICSGKIIISAFLVVLGMPIDMYGERRRRDLQACRPNVLDSEERKEYDGV